jgi:hypothetical protein
VDDEATFLIQVAAHLRSRETRTLVARRAYDRVADELARLALAGREAGGSLDTREPRPTAA